jgi:hypothetical protein
MKECRVCKKEKELDNFYFQKKGKYQRGTECKSCRSKKHKDTYTSTMPTYPEGMKGCTKCKKVMVYSKFSTTGKSVGYSSRCKKCIVEAGRPSYYMKKYGITVEDYNRMFISQGGNCAICNKPDERRLCVDHDHDTGKVRELLCNHCNTGLGKFLDSRELLEVAKNYLKKHGK